MNMKRILRGLLALALCLGMLLGPGAAVADDGKTTPEKADALYALGLFKGKGTLPDGKPDYALEDTATRSEAATMLIRLLGQEQKAKAQFDAGALRDPFTDVPRWAEANVTWLYENSYVNGMGGTLYGGGSDYTVTAQQFAAMILRSLGYQESAGDFTYKGALDFAVKKGLLTAGQRSAWETDFRRAGMVEMCYNALYLPMRRSSLTLLDSLRNRGVFLSLPAAPAAKNLGMSMKYKGGGRVDQWTVEEQVSVSPICADLDGDGKTEILFVFKSIYCLDGATGNVKWFVPSGHDITEGLKEMNIYSPDYSCFGTPSLSPLYRDVDGDGAREIVTFHNDRKSGTTFVAVYDNTGRFKFHWTTESIAFAAHVDDLDGDGKCEFAFGYGVGASMKPSLALYRLGGTMLPGWPKVQGYGFFSDTITSMDLDGNGVKELVLLYDEEHVVAYYLNGSEVLATGGAYKGVAWGADEQSRWRGIGREEALR